MVAVASAVVREKRPATKEKPSPSPGVTTLLHGGDQGWFIMRQRSAKVYAGAGETRERQDLNGEKSERSLNWATT
jgi:hypothetical protein